MTVKEKGDLAALATTEIGFMTPISNFQGLPVILVYICARITESCRRSISLTFIRISPPKGFYN
jgi:hypothetical protein